MPEDRGQCGTGYVYGDASPDIPRRRDAPVHERVETREQRYGFDWPGIGAPPRRRDQLAPSERRTRRSWAEE